MDSLPFFFQYDEGDFILYLISKTFKMVGSEREYSIKFHESTQHLEKTDVFMSIWFNVYSHSV